MSTSRPDRRDKRAYRLTLNSVMCVFAAVVMAGLGTNVVIKERNLAARGELASGVALAFLAGAWGSARA